jgi:hypothetical protein
MLRGPPPNPGTCTAGLQGFPIQVSGLNSLPSDVKQQLATPIDIELQFSPSETPIQYNQATGLYSYHGQNTFFLSGTHYNLRAMRLCQPKQEGLTSFSGPVRAELQFWGTPTATANATSQLAVLIIPITVLQANSVAGTSFQALLSGNATRLTNLFPQGQIVRYVTCLETESPLTVNLAVAYWSSGIVISADTAKLLPTLKSNGIPNLLNQKFLTVFEPVADGSKLNRRYEERDGVKQTYSKIFTATATEIQQGFRLILNSNVSMSQTVDTSEQQKLSNYKCVTIDKNRDIQNGKLVINPLTGRPFEKELEEQNAEQSAELQPAVLGANTIFIRVCIAIGVIIGIGMLAALLVYGGKLFMKPEDPSALAAGVAGVPLGP